MRRRDNRVELLGGYPGPEPDVAIAHFEPALNETERVQQILSGVSRLGAESVDEATGHPLDNLINAEGDKRARGLHRQHLAYRPVAEHRLGQAGAIVEQYQRLHIEDLARLQGAEIAVETALLALSGPEPESSSVSARFSSTRAAGRTTPGRRAAPLQASGVVLESADTAQPDVLDGRAALSPPKVSRLELRRLLDPEDAGRVPRWGDPGFRDGTLLGGRPRSAYLHALVLALAAGADVGAFVQIVELVLPVQDWVIWLVVSGLTSVVLYIAHMVGVMLREARAGQRVDARRLPRLGAWVGRRSAVFICTAVWLALGLMAFWIRLTVPLIQTDQLSAGGVIGSGGAGGIGGGIGSGGIGGGASAGGATSGHPLQGAAIFLGLYLATGIVAALGAYFTHNPYRGRYAAAVRAYRKATERASASAYQLGRAVAVYERQRAEIAAAEQALIEAEAQNRAFTEQLKQTVRLQIAALAKDPAVTDAIFGPDHDPYWPAAPDGTSPGGQEPGVRNS